MRYRGHEVLRSLFPFHQKAPTAPTLMEKEFSSQNSEPVFWGSILATALTFYLACRSSFSIMVSTKKKVRFSEPGPSASARINNNVRAGKRTSPSRTRSDASFHAKSIDPIGPGPGPKRSSFSRSPLSPPTPHPRSSQLPVFTTLNGRSSPELPAQPSLLQLTRRGPERPPKRLSTTSTSSAKSTSSSKTTILQAVPSEIVESQAVARQRSLDTYARRRFEPILRQLAKGKEATERQLEELQAMFADVATGRPVTLFGVPHGQAPERYAPPTLKPGSLKAQKYHDGEIGSDVRHGGKDRGAVRKSNQRGGGARKRVTKDSIGIAVSYGYQYQGFVCCQCRSANGRSAVSCRVCGHLYDSAACQCVDIYC